LRDRRLEKLARETGIAAQFWLLDTAKPIAFSFGRHVLVSVGMFELLTRKQQDAVVLHELSHVQRQSALTTFSTALARFFSPLAHFASVNERVNAEEQAADDFAIRHQGTTRHVNAAKQKVESFDN
jgi:Zn-dependent protease with chaperone function